MICGKEEGGGGRGGGGEEGGRGGRGRAREREAGIERESREGEVGNTLVPDIKTISYDTYTHSKPI